MLLEGVSAAANKESCYTSDTPTLFFRGNLAAGLQNLINWGNTSCTIGLSTMDGNGNGEGDSFRWKKFVQDSARLVVNYNHVPNTPSYADMAIEPSLACGVAPLRINSTQGVTLRTRLSDADGTSVQAQWTVTGLPAQYAPPGSEYVASGGEVTTRIPADAFTDGATYSWKVRAFDQADASLDGPACAFIVDNSVPAVPTATSTDLALTTGLIVPAPSATAVTGRPAAVTLIPGPGTSVVTGFLIGVGAGAPAEPSVWVPASADGRAVASVVPVAAGTTTNYLKVQARSATGQPSSTITYKFKANPGTVNHVRHDATGDGRADVTTLADAGSGKSALWRRSRSPAARAPRHRPRRSRYACAWSTAPRGGRWRSASSGRAAARSSFDSTMGASGTPTAATGAPGSGWSGCPAARCPLRTVQAAPRPRWRP